MIKGPNQQEDVTTVNVCLVIHICSFQLLKTNTSGSKATHMLQYNNNVKLQQPASIGKQIN